MMRSYGLYDCGGTIVNYDIFTASARVWCYVTACVKLEI